MRSDEAVDPELRLDLRLQLLGRCAVHRRANQHAGQAAVVGLHLFGERGEAGGAEPGPSQLLGGYAISFLVVLLVVGLVGWGVRKLVHGVGLSGIDRFLGLALGLARGAFVACALVLLMGFTALPQDADWRHSTTVRVFLPGALLMRTWLPDWAAAHASFEVAPAAAPSPGDAGASPATGAPASRT